MAFRSLGEREIYRNPWLAVRVHEVVHPNGACGEHILIVPPGASAVVAFDGASVILTEQERFGARRSVLEIVKGGADGAETPLECARRELGEELGLRAERWRALGDLYEIPSIMSCPVSLFLATDLSPVEREPERTETIAARSMSLTGALQAVLEGTIADAITAAALVRAAGALGYRFTASAARS